MTGWRQALQADLSGLLAQARGAARAYRAAAEQAALQAAEYARRLTANLPHHLSALRQTREEEIAQVQRRCRAIADSVARRLEELTGYASPGLASAPWRRWRPQWTIERTRTPDLFRVGVLRPDVPDVPSLPLLLPLLDQAHIHITGDTTSDPDRVRGLINTLLLRVLGTTPAGSVRIIVYDPEQLGGALAGFAPLASAGLLRFVGPTGLSGLLDDLTEEVRRINESVLSGEYASLWALADATGRRPEPWRIIVLLGGDSDAELTGAQRAQLARVVRTGVPCGIHLIATGLQLEPHESVVTVEMAEVIRTSVTGDLPVELDPPPPAELVTGTCRALAEKVAAGPDPTSFDQLLPDRFWQESSARGLTAPVGEGSDGRLVHAPLGDSPPHALIGGPSGSGKTNFLFAWIGALAARYDPDELELYLLDFKEGVSFARLAPGRKDPSWLPHVRLIGVNINSDREYGLALLRYLHEQLRHRAEAAKRHEATKLEELRAEDPGGRWPRIMAVIDEFQVLLSERDAVTAEAVRLLEDLARRGRSQGIHLVLASQSVSGIDALWGRSSLVAQFTLRIALPKARRILADTNSAADRIPRYHAVVNPDSGATSANQIARIPDATSRGTFDALQRRLWELRPGQPPRLFDGDNIPTLADAPDFRELTLSVRRAPVVLVGQTIDVIERSATMKLSRAPGRNLAVLGTRLREACEILASVGLSLARQHPPDGARFSVVCCDDDAVEYAEALVDQLTAQGHHPRWFDAIGARDLLAEVAAELATARGETPHYLLMYAVDAASVPLEAKDPRTRVSGLDHLRQVVARGPELRTHVLGWWRSVPRLRETLGGVSAKLDGIGAWVALDVHGGELAPLVPQVGGPSWYPRPWRALYFDRSTHRTPEVIIPYRAGKEMP